MILQNFSSSQDKILHLKSKEFWPRTGGRVCRKYNFVTLTASVS